MELKKGIRSFNVTGKLRLTNNTFNIDKQKEGSNYVYSNASLSLDCGSGNVFCNIVGGHFKTGENVIYALGTKIEDGKVKTDYKKSLRIPFEKRFDEDTLKTVANDSFTFVNIEKDSDGNLISKKFLAKEDAIKYLQGTLEDGMVLNVLGDISFRVADDGRTLFTLNIKRVYLNEKPNPTFHANFTMAVVTDKDCYDSAQSIDENGYVNVDCYVAEYMKSYRGLEKAVVPLPFSFAMDTKANTNWKSVITNFFRPQNNFLAETTIEGYIASVGNTQEVTMDDIPDDVKQLVELGLISKEELASIGTNNNSLVQKLVFTRPNVIIKDGGMVIMSNKEKYDTTILEFENQNSKKATAETKPVAKSEEKTSNELFAELFGD